MIYSGEMKIAVFGANGRMGTQICEAVAASRDLELVARIDQNHPRDEALQADVIIDFTHPEAVMDNLEWCIRNNLHVVVGTTGFTDERLTQVRSWLESSSSHVIIAANFSIAAVLMMHFAEIAAPFFESVEIVELHHPRKADAPSGTAATTAKRVAGARTAAGCEAMPDATEISLPGARGAEVEGVHIHSVRLQGLFAHQEVIFGNPGEMLTIRDDSFDRASYLPGILTAARRIREVPGLTIGIEALLGIG